jgi:hypothetical protein
MVRDPWGGFKFATCAVLTTIRVNGRALVDGVAESRTDERYCNVERDPKLDQQYMKCGSAGKLFELKPPDAPSETPSIRQRLRGFLLGAQ